MYLKEKLQQFINMDRYVSSLNYEKSDLVEAALKNVAEAKKIRF